MASLFIDNIESSLVFKKERLKTFFEHRVDGTCVSVKLWSAAADIIQEELAKDGFYFFEEGPSLRAHLLSRDSRTVGRRIYSERRAPEALSSLSFHQSQARRKDSDAPLLIPGAHVERGCS